MKVVTAVSDKNVGEKLLGLLQNTQHVFEPFIFVGQVVTLNCI